MGLPRMPRPDEDVLHVHSTAGQIGPISRTTLARTLAEGGIPASANLWMDGMGGWEPLDTHRATLLDGIGAQPVVEPVVAERIVAEPIVAAESVTVAGETADDALDRVFGDLVKNSWSYLEEHRFAAHIDEVFVGAVITSTLDTGYSLIDLSSDGTHHFLRFENLSDRTRIVVRLTHLTGSLAIAKVLGQRMSAIIGYGEKVGNMGKIWSAIQAEMKSAYIQDAEPGTITVDGDMNSGYVYCQVDLTLDIERYVSKTYAVDYPQLSSHIGATTHALRKYLRGRFA